MQSIRRGRALVLLCGILLAPAALGAGLTVRDGVLLKDGKPYRAMGINAVGLADEILAKGKGALRSFQAIEYLGRRHVPFIRFWASYFDNWKPYREDPQRYWQNMDLLVEACEKAGVGLAPTLFWNPWEIPFQFGEFRPAWLDDESQTRRFVDRYTREFVRRYRGRRAVWIWEFANEDNLEWDLPNAMSFLPEGRKDNRNIVRSAMGMLAERTFARNVRKVDRRRPISSGATEVRPGQFRLAAVPLTPGEEWGTDTAEQAFEATTWTAPAPVDLLSMHHYAVPAGYDPAAMREWLAGRGRVGGEVEASAIPRRVRDCGAMGADAGRFGRCGIPGGAERFLRGGLGIARGAGGVLGVRAGFPGVHRDGRAGIQAVRVCAGSDCGVQREVRTCSEVTPWCGIISLYEGTGVSGCAERGGEAGGVFRAASS